MVILLPASPRLKKMGDALKKALGNKQTTPANIVSDLVAAVQESTEDEKNEARPWPSKNFILLRHRAGRARSS